MVGSVLIWLFSAQSPRPLRLWGKQTLNTFTAETPSTQRRRREFQPKTLLWSQKSPCPRALWSLLLQSRFRNRASFPSKALRCDHQMLPAAATHHAVRAAGERTVAPLRDRQSTEAESSV